MYQTKFDYDLRPDLITYVLYFKQSLSTELELCFVYMTRILTITYTRTALLNV